MSETPKRPADVSSRTEGERGIRIERAVVMAVVHGYQQQPLGYNEAIVDLALIDKAAINEINNTLFWALGQLGRVDGLGLDVLRRHLQIVSGVPEKPEAEW